MLTYWNFHFLVWKTASLSFFLHPSFISCHFHFTLPSCSTIMIYPNVLYQTLLKIFPFFLEILILPVALSMVRVRVSLLDAVYGGGGVGANIKALRKRVRVHFLPLLINPFDHQRTRSRFHQRYSLTCPQFARALWRALNFYQTVPFKYVMNFAKLVICKMDEKRIISQQQSQPLLSLGHNGNGGNWSIGYWFSLDGVGEIERERAREVGAECEMQVFEIFCSENEGSYWKQVILLRVLSSQCIVGLQMCKHRAECTFLNC